MSPDILSFLSFEIKKEIADRYFGFRKIIEEDKLDLSQRIKQHSFILQKRISFELLRIYAFLKEEKLIQSFLDISGLDKDTFYDPQFTRLETLKERVFSGITLRGFTMRGKAVKLLFDCYDRLSIHAHQYHNKIEELRELKETIDEEIKVFYEQNELGTILGFLKSLDDPAVAGGIEGGLEVGLAASLEEIMKIEPPMAIERCLPVMSPLPSLSSVRKRIKHLAIKAYNNHGRDFLNSLQVGKTENVRKT
jgi:hypothetical protein